MKINRKIRWFKSVTQAAGVLSIALAAVSLFLTNQAIRTSYTIDADKTSEQLLLNWYAMKEEQKREFGISSIEEPMKTEIAAYKTLFIAESIFLMMKTSDRPTGWLGTVDFLIRDATGLKIDDKVIDGTYNAEFAKRVKVIFADGKNNKNEIAQKIADSVKTNPP